MKGNGLRATSHSLLGWSSQIKMRFYLVLICTPLLCVATPRFDPDALLRDVLIPADAALGTVIYRLRASDTSFDYPLKFSIQGDFATVSIDTLNCTRFNSVCQANVILRKKLEPNRFYDFQVDVANTRGAIASIKCSFRGTNATTPFGEIFPGAPTLFVVSENARRNTELGSVIARGNPGVKNPVFLELWGDAKFGLHQKLLNERDAQATIILLNSLDYEEKNVHRLTILANDPWTDSKTDTRNIAGWPLLVVVTDEQDTPPIFTLAPPTTPLGSTLTPGDLVLQVHAEDGDRGNPRAIRYGLVPDDNPFADFFEIDENTGELHLARPLSEIQSITHSNEPILLTVIAEEVRDNPKESPAQSSTIKLALIPPAVTAGQPIFGSKIYNALIKENSPPGTLLNLAQAKVQTQPGDVVTLKLTNNNGTFEISPSVVEGQSNFQIRVHDPGLLDFEERRTVECLIIANEVGSGNLTATAKLIVLLEDINDNPPEFSQNEYSATVQENAETGTTVIRVEATDLDTNPGNKIRYTALTGPGSELFKLDPHTGLITVINSQGLDAEIYQKLDLTVEATDEDGNGLKSYAKLTVTLLDINDEPPIFEKNIYEFIINSERSGFTTRAFIKALDKDVTFPNNEVHYELTTKGDNVVVHEYTGELSLTGVWKNQDVLMLTARAWDGGVPRLFDECKIRIYPTETRSRKMTFIVPGSDPDVEMIADTLRTITGGRVTIDDVRPYDGNGEYTADISRDSDSERSVVAATIHYTKEASVIDVKKIQETLDRDYRRRVKREPIEKASTWWWILLLLLFLILLLALIFLLCCLWDRCPYYAQLQRLSKRRKLKSAETVTFITKSAGQGHQSKSVQVAEWFGRREAWTPDPEAELDSLRRHELDRGSDRYKRSIPRQQHVDTDTDQYYVREGNADILRILTRGQNETQQQRPVTLVTENAYLTDSGKDALLKRFIDQQSASRSEMNLPNAVSKLQTEHEMLEASLRQQNALLRQILQERERDLKLETQSLPAGTQTDQDRGTQTDQQFFKIPIREIQSDNDLSDLSDDELAIIKAKVRRRSGYRSFKARRRIKTPILEESEVDGMDNEFYAEKKPTIKHTRTSTLRQKPRTTKSGIRREVLKEISASLSRDNFTDNSDEEIIRKKKSKRRSQSESRLSKSSIRREIIQEITSSLKPNYIKYQNSDSDEYRTDSSKIKSRKKRSMSETRASRSGIQREVLKEIVSSLKPDIESLKLALKSKQEKRHSSSSSGQKRSSSESRVKSGIKMELLKEIAASLHGDPVKVEKEYTDDTLESSPRYEDKKIHKSQLDLSNLKESTKKTPKRSQSHESLAGKSINKTESAKSTKQQPRSTARYMEWYNKKQEQNKKTQPVKKPVKRVAKKLEGEIVEKKDEKLDLEIKSNAKKKTEQKKKAVGPDHPLLQHSEYRYEGPYNSRRVEDDVDSGIALTRPAIAQKKSVFTIKYDDMHTSQIRADSTMSP